MFRYLTISFTSISLIIAQFILSTTPVLAEHDGYSVSCNGNVVTIGGSSGTTITRGDVTWTCKNGVPQRNGVEHDDELSIFESFANAFELLESIFEPFVSIFETIDENADYIYLILMGVSTAYIWNTVSGSDDENSFISFKTIKADNHIYSQTRQWIGFEHDVSQNFKIALGSFWFVHNDAASILPSAENIGGELVFALGARKSAKGELALTISAFVNDQSANLDDSLRVATDRFGVWDERIALTWRKAF